MKRVQRILLALGFLALLIISWAVAISARSNAEKQLELIEQAANLLEDDIYIRAVPLLEEAAAYNASYTLSAETMLKTAYLGLIDKAGYRRKYTNLLDKQMSRKDASSEVYVEAARYYLALAKLPDALSVLKAGIEKTGGAELLALYEENRYAYQLSRNAYEEVTAIYGGAIQVQSHGLWGIAKSDGSPLIPCEYEKISTFSIDRAIAKKGSEIFAVDSANNRLAKMHENAGDFGNYAFDHLPVFIAGSWKRYNGELEPGNMSFEAFGMYSQGYAAAKENGKWGIIDAGADWLIPPSFDELIMDELGRCYEQNALFFIQTGAVYLFSQQRVLAETYEDAKPFGDAYAAVKKDGKWGFIDCFGTARIEFIFEDALSFGEKLAAVKWHDLWGYIDINGNIVIEPVFLQAKSFYNGSAPVLTERGWQFITLIDH